MAQLVGHCPAKWGVTCLTPVRACALVVGVWSLVGVGPRVSWSMFLISMFLSLSFSLPSPLSKNKLIQKQMHYYNDEMHPGIFSSILFCKNYYTKLVSLSTNELWFSIWKTDVVLYIFEGRFKAQKCDFPGSHSQQTNDFLLAPFFWLYL